MTEKPYVNIKINSSIKKFIDRTDSSYFQIGSTGTVLKMDLDVDKNSLDEDNDDEEIIVYNDNENEAFEVGEESD